MAPTQNKVAIVTGGLSGIGDALTRTLIGSGWDVVALDLPSQSHVAQQLAEEHGDPFEFMACDVSQYQELAQCFSTTFEKKGRLDAFCSNAGFEDQSSVYLLANRGKSERVPPQPNTLSTDLCYKALIYGTTLSVHFMRQNPTPGGFIVGTASICALHACPSFPEYSGAKAAMNYFVEACAPILKLHDNITINTVCPGAVPTNKIPQGMRDALGEESLTPRATIVAAYMKFLNDPSLTGEWAEASSDKVRLQEKLAYMNGEVSRRTVQVWDPYFEAIHGTVSGLPDNVRLI
ncbi:hypothetical protein LTR67_002228 [Exophiala xenobiotica]